MNLELQSKMRTTKRPFLYLLPAFILLVAHVSAAIESSNQRLAMALKRVGTDQKKLLREIYSMKFAGSFAEYSFDDYGDLNFTSWKAWQVTAKGYSPNEFGG